MVVHVQPIRHAAESSKRLQPAHHARLDRVAGTLDFGVVRAVAAEAFELGVDRRLHLIDRMPWTCGHLDVEHRPEHQRVLLRDDALCNLLVVDEPLIEARRLPVAKNGRRDVGIGVTRREDR